MKKNNNVLKLNISIQYINKYILFYRNFFN